MGKHIIYQSHDVFLDSGDFSSIHGMVRRNVQYILEQPVRHTMRGYYVSNN